MKFALLIAWLLIPLALTAYHFGPGQDAMRRDQAAKFVRAADDAWRSEDYAAAIKACDAALEKLPEANLREARRVRFMRAKARMLAHQLPTAERELTDLFAELAGDSASDTALRAEVRVALANAKYYLAWLLRLEGRPEEEWQPEIEAARQHFRLLADEAQKKNDPAVLKARQEDLESSIKLARMDLTELQGLPLPKQ